MHTGRTRERVTSFSQMYSGLDLHEEHFLGQLQPSRFDHFSQHVPIQEAPVKGFFDEIKRVLRPRVLVHYVMSCLVKPDKSISVIFVIRIHPGACRLGDLMKLV